MKKNYKDFENAIEVLERNGYKYRFNDTTGNHEFVTSEENISIYDYVNEEGDASDYDKIVREIYSEFSFIDFE